MIFHYHLFDMRDGWASLSRRPLRSLLSSLGIGIGVTALIAMLSIGEGAKKSALDKIASLGTDALRIENNSQAAFTGRNSLANISKGLVVADAEYLAEWLGTRGNVGAYVRRENVTISREGRSVVATVLGVSAGWFEAEKVQLQSGRSVNQGDITLRENVCVAGSRITTILGTAPGSSIMLQRFPSNLVGVLAPKGRLLTEGTGLSALDFDNTVILPIFSLQAIFPGKDEARLDGLVITLNDSDEASILSIGAQVEEILLVRHKGVEDYSLVIPLNLLKEARDSQRLFSLIMGTIAGLSLLVGGIGVMNVMLANIAEQTREIGLRMAVGASRSRIANLYLWNSFLLTMTGGIWGMAAGVILALFIQKYAGWDVAFSSFSLIVAPLSALITGIVFGVHPAVRAASLQPASALRDS